MTPDLLSVKHQMSRVLEEMTQHLVSGRAKSYEEYRECVGVIRGCKVAIEAAESVWRMEDQREV